MDNNYNLLAYQFIQMNRSLPKYQTFKRISEIFASQMQFQSQNIIDVRKAENVNKRSRTFKSSCMRAKAFKCFNKLHLSFNFSYIIFICKLNYSLFVLLTRTSNIIQHF